MKTLASSFADLADIQAFNKCKAQGKSDAECFRVGDNGIGCWGDVTSQETTPMCALPREVIAQKFGNWKRGHNARVMVVANGQSVRCLLADIMTYNLKSGAGIDLNPAAANRLKLKPPFLVPVSWSWANE